MEQFKKSLEGKTVEELKKILEKNDVNNDSENSDN